MFGGLGAIPECPGCHERLRVREVRGRRYWWCACSHSEGPAEIADPPRCNLCGEEMKRRLGERGRWVGRWFWFCDTHVVPNATATSHLGPRILPPCTPRSPASAAAPAAA